MIKKCCKFDDQIRVNIQIETSTNLNDKYRDINIKNNNILLKYIKWNLVVILITYLIKPQYVSAIGCYKCSTLNNDTACVDPFSPGNAPKNLSGYFDQDCYAGQQGRIGLFPARYCLKVSGYIAGTSNQLVIRTCTVFKLLDSDSSHSSFKIQLLDGDVVEVESGLIASCKDDGCNKSIKSASTNVYITSIIVILSIILLKLISIP